MNKIIQGDCLIELKQLEENSVDSIVCDPPYELGFMGKSWDNTGIANNPLMWAECLRVLKPGGYLLSFGGTRTYHRMASAIEDAGFEVRDMIEWVYGSGFPKSLNIGKAVDKLQGNEREVTGYDTNTAPDLRDVGAMSKEATGIDKLSFGQNPRPADRKQIEITKGTSEWEGWGTALKPAHEPICMARKPLAEKTVALNVLKYGTGGINIDESRVKHNDPIKMMKAQTGGDKVFSQAGRRIDMPELKESGRFPANLIHDNSEEVRECFPDVKGATSRTATKPSNATSYSMGGDANTPIYQDNQTNASRFFKSIIYQAKSSKSERNKGLDSIVLVDILRVWNENNTTKEEKLIRLMVTGISPQKVIGESGVQLKNANEWNTCLFGKHLMEKYQEGIKSITKTETNSITTSQISNWLTHLLTNEYIADVKSETENGGNLVANVENSNTLIFTINEAMALALGVKDVVSGTQLKISVKEGSNIHSTVKPIALMEYLIKMVTPKGGTVLDPFSGSGSTLVAAKRNGFKYIGIEMTAEYIPIIEARLKAED